MLFRIYIFIFSFFMIASSQAEIPEIGLFAKIETNKGTITAQLYYQYAPLTVMNFIGLAEGNIEWQNPTTGKITKEPLYQNLIFHHVRGFMVQTGDPTGQGKGGPGFTFADEFHPALTHEKAGILSMANLGTNTNGSQFIITRQPAKWLDNHHSIFGMVVDGLNIVDSIEKGDQLKKITILRLGEEANLFNIQKAHQLAESNLQAFKLAAQKTLPDTLGILDPQKEPQAHQAFVSPGDFEFIVIGHTEMMSKIPNKHFYYDHQAALKLATKLVRYARAQNVDFNHLIQQYSDMERNVRTQNVTDNNLPAPLRSIFHLKSGQISDPIDLPIGIYIFHRL